MNTLPPCGDTCARVDPRLYKELSALGVRNVLDIAGFRQPLGYTPCGSSVFLIEPGALASQRDPRAGR